MNIQLFASWDELTKLATEGKEQTQAELNNLSVEKQSLIDEYNKNYDNQLNQYENLVQQQQNLIDTESAKQAELQQKKTDYNINLINQNKEEAKKTTEAETGDAYVDYLKSTNQYGGNNEILATAGLNNQGIQETSRIAMNITYQNRVGTAKAALLKANTQYDNQIQQALLNNDATLAEIALNQLKQKYQLALSGFEYKTNLLNEKQNYMQNLNDSYFTKGQTLQSRIDTYNNTLQNIKQAQEDIAYKKEQLAENRRQFNANLAEEKRQFEKKLAASNTTSNISYSDGKQETNANSTSNSTSKSKSNQAILFDARTNNIPGLNSLLGLNAFTAGKIYTDGSKYWYYDDKLNENIDITFEVKTGMKSWYKK